MPGSMVTCGSGHIKSWKMAHSFTGFKLQGELGRFGKTEISDIIGVYPMPDEKVRFFKIKIVLLLRFFDCVSLVMVLIFV